jgi:hypothetical protein
MINDLIFGLVLIIIIVISTAAYVYFRSKGKISLLILVFPIILIFLLDKAANTVTIIEDKEPQIYKTFYEHKLYYFKNSSPVSVRITNNTIINNTHDTLIIEKVFYGFLLNGKNQQIISVIPPFKFENCPFPIDFLLTNPPKKINVKHDEDVIKIWLHKK